MCVTGESRRGVFFFCVCFCCCCVFFFFNDTATTEIYTLSLHDALPIWWFGRGWIISSGESAEVGKFVGEYDRWDGHDKDASMVSLG